MEKFKKVLKDIYSAWRSLPKTTRVVAYLAFSQALAQLIVELSNIQTDSIILGIILNVVIVFLRELTPPVYKRVQNHRGIKTSNNEKD